jgi:hypothetical protein
MRRTVLVSAFLLIASSALSAVHAQDQPVLVKGESLIADYPTDRAGVFIQNSKWTLLLGQRPAKTRVGRSIAASLSYGVVPAKIVSEYNGEHAPTQVETVQPILCICHFVSLPGDPVLVRMHPKKGLRELDGGRMIVYPQVWLVHPQIPLEPGEYALMMGTQNLYLYPFTVVLPSTPPSGSK